MDTQHDPPIKTSSRRWLISAAVILALIVVFVGYWWNRERRWTLIDGDGRSVCRVREGWSEQDVVAHCGARSGRGVQPKVLASGTGLDFHTCSAPGDVYGSKAVLYGCDGKVQAVEDMPAKGFIYPSR